MKKEKMEKTLTASLSLSLFISSFRFCVPFATNRTKRETTRKKDGNSQRGAFFFHAHLGTAVIREAAEAASFPFEETAVVAVGGGGTTGIVEQ